jgi:very-short-patch-repair endonuclease
MLGTVSVAELLHELGGVATRARLVRACSRAEVDRALASGAVVADARGRYTLPSTEEGLRRAHALSGVLGWTSAALWHGWEVMVVPDEPHVIIPRKRRLHDRQRVGVHLHRADLLPEERSGPATDVETTLLHCLRGLPLAEALAVADSALRHGVPPATLRRVASLVQGPGAPQVRRVAAAARAEAANPFESGLRAVALDVPGLDVEPQVLIRTTTGWARPDLVDRELRIVLEADSFAWHGGRQALARDARRYNRLVVDGWVVLRFSWEDVMFHDDDVRQILLAVVDLVVHRQAEVRDCCRCSA